jgi:hypothetical protein
MWSDKKPWWQRKAKDNNPAENSHYRNWCVVKVAVAYRHNITSWSPAIFYEYKAVAKLNAPMMYGSDGKISKAIEVDNLTKHEAYCVAKGLNFLDKE